MILLILPSFIIIGLLDLPKLIKAGYCPDIIAYVALYLAALVLSILLSVGTDIPSPTLWFEHIIRDILHISFA